MKCTTWSHSYNESKEVDFIEVGNRTMLTEVGNSSNVWLIVRGWSQVLSYSYIWTRLSGVLCMTEWL